MGGGYIFHLGFRGEGGGGWGSLRAGWEICVGGCSGRGG